MSDVTAVPLPPVKKGGLWLLWLGIAAVMALGAYLAVRQTPQIGFTTIKAGAGPKATASDVAIITYEGRLDNGKVFDANAEGVPFPVSKVVPGFSMALKRMQKGGKYNVTIPSSLGYGDRDNGPIPANSTLHFTVEVKDIMSEQQMQMMQQMQQMQQMEQLQGAGKQ